MNLRLALDKTWQDRLDRGSVFLATCFYSSSLPPKLAERLKRYPQIARYVKPGWTGSGISGSIVGILTYVLLPRAIAVSPIAILAGVFFSVWVSHRAEKVLGVHDDSRIVIDEWIGAWIAAWGLWHKMGFPVLVAFVLFRFFDVWKGPWGKRLQKLPGGWGIVMDDVAAGLVANFCARIVVVFVGVL